MDKLKFNKQDFLIGVIYISMIYILTTLIGKVVGLTLTIYTQIAIVLIISTIVKYFIIYPIFFLVSSIIGFISMLFINRYKFPIFLLAQDRFTMLFSNTIDNLRNLDPISESNIILLYLIIVLFTSIFTALIIYRMKSIFILAPIYLFIFLIYWYSFIDEAYIFTVLFLFLFLILFGIDKYKKDSQASNKTFNIWSGTSIIYSILIISIAFSLPKSDNFISWPALQQRVYNKFPVVEDLRYYKEYNRQTSTSRLFNFSSSGFSEDDKELGGPLILSERKVMTVESKAPLYLRGNVKHLYTGRSWINLSTTVLEHNMKQDFSFLSDSEKKDFYIHDEISIEFDSFSSKTIFTPYKPESISSNRDFPIFINNDDIVSSTDGIYKNEGYTVDFLKPLPYENLIGSRVNKRKADLPDLNTYLDLPEDMITDRTRQLSSSLVETFDSDYEKALSIQNYLRYNYKYNLNVKDLPEGEDFIDHFLFEEKEGYCTYYASAMAVMLRLENIPTRYVEGYIVDEQIEENKYQVRQKHAHAWVEAFIEPVGWISFEPTAAYEPLDDEDVEEDEVIPDIREEEEVTEDEDLTKPPIVENQDNYEVENNTIDDQPDNNISMFKIIPISLIIIFLLVIFIRILMRYLKYRRKEKYFHSLGDRSKIIFLYKDITDLVDILGFPMLTGETHFEYIDRIDFKFIDSDGHKIEDITDIFVKLKYSDKKVLDSHLSSMDLFKMELSEKLQTQIGKSNYLYRKYINIYFKQKKEIP